MPVSFRLLTSRARGDAGAFPPIDRIDGPGHVQVLDCPVYRVARVGTELFTVASWLSGVVVASVTRLSRITSHVGSVGTSCTTEPTVVDKPARR